MRNFGYVIGDPAKKVAAVVDPSFDARVLQKVDRAALACYCEAWGEFVQLSADVDRLRAGAGDAPPSTFTTLTGLWRP